MTERTLWFDVTQLLLLVVMVFMLSFGFYWMLWVTGNV